MWMRRNWFLFFVLSPSSKVERWSLWVRGIVARVKVNSGTVSWKGTYPSFGCFFFYSHEITHKTNDIPGMRDELFLKTLYRIRNVIHIKMFTGHSEKKKTKTEQNVHNFLEKKFTLNWEKELHISVISFSFTNK